MTARDESKLPAWARDELAKLRGEVERLKENVKYTEDRLRQATGEDPSPITWTSGAAMVGGKHGHLPSDATIRFKTDDRFVGFIDVHLSRREDKVILDVRSGRGLRIRPLSGNHVEAETE